MTDIQMPEMHGFEVILALGYLDALHAKFLGALELIEKPFPLVTLASAIVAALD